MLMDFERFTTAAKLAYRRCGGCAYSLDEVLQVFRYYFQTYEMVMETAHPPIQLDQVTRIIEKMPCVLDDTISPECYNVLIDQHFITKYARCDYNINHFFSGKIRETRYYETCY